MASVTWLHLSDWHQRIYQTLADKHGCQKVAVELLRDIKRQMMTRRISRIDFIVFSGDTANEGHAEQYAEANRTLFAPLLRFTGVSPERCFVVAGNHDVDRRILKFLPPSLQNPCDPLTFSTSTMDGIVADAVGCQDLRKPFEHFRDFASAFRPNADWAYRDIFSTSDGIEVEIAALNSALYCGRQSPTVPSRTQDYGGLFVGDEQLKVLPNHPSLRLSQNNRRICIAVLHHPFPWFYQAEQTRLQEALFDLTNFVLVGHEHNQRVEEVVSNYGDVVVIPAGPCYDRSMAASGNPADRYGMAYNIVRLDTDANGWTGRIWLRRWDGNRQRFAEDMRYPTLPDKAYPLRSLSVPAVGHWTPPPGASATSVMP